MKNRTTPIKKVLKELLRVPVPCTSVLVFQNGKNPRRIRSLPRLDFSPMRFKKNPGVKNCTQPRARRFVASAASKAHRLVRMARGIRQFSVLLAVS
jgi:hypothetical protein